MLGHGEVEHPTRVGAHLVVAGVERVLQGEAAASVAVGRGGDVDRLPLHNKTVGGDELNIKDAAQVGGTEVVGARHVGLVPQRVANEIALVVEVQVHLLLDGSPQQLLAKLVQLTLTEEVAATPKKKDEENDVFHIVH